MRKLVSLAAVAITFITACGAYDGSSIPPTGDEEATETPAPKSSSSKAPDPPNAPPANTPRTTDLHRNEVGDPKNQAVVFLHGGPGANSMMFELTAQEPIAKRGYYVVSYDQRGSTRSPKGTAADYSFARATQDLDDLIGALGLDKPILLGKPSANDVVVAASGS